MNSYSCKCSTSVIGGISIFLMLYLRHLSQLFCIYHSVLHIERIYIFLTVIFHLYETTHQALVSKGIETKKALTSVDKFLLS